MFPLGGAQEMIADVDHVYQQHVQLLSDTEQLRLVERIVKGLAGQPRDAPAPARSIMELHGRGAELWRGVDPGPYVENLRSEWEHRP
jgi:hypothetical protein